MILKPGTSFCVHITPIRTIPRQPLGQVTASIETNFILSAGRLNCSIRAFSAARCAGVKSTGICVEAGCSSGYDGSPGYDGSSVAAAVGAQAATTIIRTTRTNKTLLILTPF